MFFYPNAFRLNYEDAKDIEAMVNAMMSTGKDYWFEDVGYEEYSTPIHNLVSIFAKWSEDKFNVMCDVLRGCLYLNNYKPPDGKFIFFGGRCIPTPFLYVSDEECKDISKHMADAIVEKMGTEGPTPEEDVIDVLLESAAMDDRMLAYRTAAIIDALNENYPEADYKCDFGDFTILPSGEILFLNYLRARWITFPVRRTQTT